MQIVAARNTKQRLLDVMSDAEPPVVSDAYCTHLALDSIFGLVHALASLAVSFSPAATNAQTKSVRTRLVAASASNR